MDKDWKDDYIFYLSVVLHIDFKTCPYCGNERYYAITCQECVYKWKKSHDKYWKIKYDEEIRRKKCL